MSGILTTKQINRIGDIKQKFREDSEFSSLIITRKYIITQGSFDAYGIGSTKYLDKIYKVRLVHIDNKWERIEVGGNIIDATYKMIIDKNNKINIRDCDEVIINHNFSLMQVSVPSIIHNNSVTNIIDYTNTKKYINYDSSGLVIGDKLVILGEKEISENRWETILFLRGKDINA